MDKNNTPQVRFKGFTDDWEQRKLGELVQFSKGTGYSKADLKEKGTPIILYGRLYTKYETVITEIDTYADEKAGSVYSRGGEVIVPASGETAEDISIASVVEKLGILLGGDLNIITPSSILDSAFLAISISNGKPHSDMAKMAQGKSVVHLHNSDLEKIDLNYPCFKEQIRISAFFKGIDNLITLHQRKLKMLINVKKSCLEKMFPKKDASVPEVRFANFTDSWEQRKLGEIATEIVAGGDVDKDLLVQEGKYPVIANALSNDGIIGYYAEEYRIKAPAVTVTGRGDVGHAQARNVDFTPVVRLLSLKSEHDVYFLENAINTLRIVIESTGVPQLTVPQLEKHKISVPKEKNEERIIGQFFLNLDNLITLHHRKLEKLQNIKKSCLEKMFI